MNNDQRTADRGAEKGAPGLAEKSDPFARLDPPVLEITLWPHRSLSKKGSVWILGIVAVGLSIPIIPFVGTRVVLGLIPFALLALLSLYLALRRSFFDGRLTEHLRLWPDLITVERREPKGTVKRWHANPFWVRLRLIENAHIEKYLTLEGNSREIELGAFLSPPEREALYHDLDLALVRVKRSELS